MANRWFITYCAGLMLMALAATPAAATTVKTFAFEEMCETAQTIVHVQCLARENAIFPKRKGIFTQTRFRVLEVVKGQADEEWYSCCPAANGKANACMCPGYRNLQPAKKPCCFSQKPTLSALHGQSAWGRDAIPCK